MKILLLLMIAMACSLAAEPASSPEKELKDEKPDYPKPPQNVVAVPTKSVDDLEDLDAAGIQNRVTFKIPKDAANVARHKKVTSSDPLPIMGSLRMVTDGDLDAVEATCLELSPGKQWVQIDLGADYQIWKILLWHNVMHAFVYFDVVVQISDDPEFKKDVTTVFNNDFNNELGLGAGFNRNYVESTLGRLIDVRGVDGRYVRFWSKGNNANELNHYVEVNVYGSPVK